MSGSRGKLRRSTAVTPEEATDLARRVAESEGWPWTLPVEVTSQRRWLVGRRYWVVRTAAGRRGSSVRIEIDDGSQRVTLKGYIPR